ncbi:MAG: putative quorum-quenching lactonase YtnP [Luteibacter sp.]|uniref:MBL fold metallo-hydrolase n=1 Tax=Luteibacter sp. TaxID=1886636 RepID=UPI00137F40F5|nr:MBL fold metallo-hydrolase [Luteibacter sp.]KAF1006196.1 MAG: putative quorum-quenching lactonase YtnP [Luteibacter sp.]
MRTRSLVLKATAGLFLATAITFALPGPVGAEPAMAAAHPAQIGVFRYRLGDFEVTALSDGTVPLDLHELLKGVSPADIDKALAGSFRRNPAETSINAFLVDTGSRRVLIDTGAGGRLLDSLKAAGYEPSQIDDILLTHAHGDHAGGLVHDGALVFPKATVHIAKADVDFFLDPAHQNGVPGYDKSYFVSATASLGPVKAAGKLDTFTGADQILPGIVSVPAPGHTPGHSFYRVESKGQSMLFIGDLVHAEAVQLPNPKVTIAFDVDQSKAQAKRVADFKQFATSGQAVAAAHLPFPGIGHIRRQGAGYDFVPVDFVNRDGQ